MTEIRMELYKKSPVRRQGLESSTVKPILFIDCRLPDLVIPAKAGIQALPVSIMYNFFGNFLTIIGITILSVT